MLPPEFICLLCKYAQIGFFYNDCRNYEMSGDGRIIYVPSERTVLVSKRIHSLHSFIPFAV